MIVPDWDSNLGCLECSRKVTVEEKARQKLSLRELKIISFGEVHVLSCFQILDIVIYGLGPIFKISPC